MITQFGLAYIAEMILVSGANDHQQKHLSQLKNIFAVAQIHGYTLVEPPLEIANGTGASSILPLIIRLGFEQFRYQEDDSIVLTRNLVLFNELAEKNNLDIGSLPALFEKNTGLKIIRFVQIGMVVFAAALRSPELDLNAIEYFGKSQGLFTRDELDRFIEIQKADYNNFRLLDKELNKNVKPDFTKTRINPLTLFPIIETTSGVLIVPNLRCYSLSITSGLYWWFDRYFRNHDMQRKFRNYFGHIFEQYSGQVLEAIYGNSLLPKLTYQDGKREFFDWIVEREGVVYLFEVSSGQLALQSMQTGDIGNGEAKKLKDKILQIHRRINDIDKYPELKRFVDKKLVIFLVFLNMPSISSNLYNDTFDNLSLEAQKETGSIRELEILRINIEDLELYEGTTKTTPLEDILKELLSNNQENFYTLVKRKDGKTPRSTYLGRKYKNLMRTAFKA